jgi:hypothetical protein
MNMLFGLRIQIVALLFCATLLILLFRLIVKKRLREEYSIIWLFFFAFLLLFVIFRSEIDKIASFMGVYYAPSLLFLVLIGVLIFFCLHLSVVASKQSWQIKELAQKIALMEQKNNDSLD